MHKSEFEDAYEDVLEEADGLKAAVLETPVEQLMHRNPLVVDVNTTVVDAVHAMNGHQIGCVLVQKNGKLHGIFTERDVLRKVIFQDGNRAWKVDAVMTHDPETLPLDASIAFALNKMSVDGYRHIPIVNPAGQAVGVLSVKDIIHFLVEFFPKDVLNLPSHPDHSLPRTADGG